MQLCGNGLAVIYFRPRGYFSAQSLCLSTIKDIVSNRSIVANPTHQCKALESCPHCPSVPWDGMDGILSTNSCSHGHSFAKLWYNTKHKRLQLHYYSLDEGGSVLEVSIHQISDTCKWNELELFHGTVNEVVLH